MVKTYQQQPGLKNGRKKTVDGSLLLHSEQFLTHKVSFETDVWTETLPHETEAGPRCFIFQRETEARLTTQATILTDWL